MPKKRCRNPDIGFIASIECGRICPVREDQELPVAHDRTSFSGLAPAPRRSISDNSKHQRLADNNKESLSPEEMLSELRADSLELTRFLRQTHEICDKHNDVATASLIENWIDQTERRAWFLSETLTNL